jgi:hypothetical protein
LIDGVWALRLIDRLVHHCHIVNIRGNSYRKKHHAEFYAALHPHEHEREQDRPAKSEASRREVTAR